MAFGVLDQATLFVVTAMVIGFSGLVLVLMLARDRGQSSVALMIWGVAMIVGASGIVCFALEADWGQAADDSGNTLILLGTGLSWTAARAFDGRRPRPTIVVAGPMAWLLWNMLPRHSGTAASLILVLILGSAYTIATALELWHGRDEKLQSRMAAVVLLLLHAAVYLGRAVSEGLRPPAGWPHENEIAASLMIEALLHTVAMAFLLLGLTKERAELRSTIQLRNLASHDGLTGLGNRRAFDIALDREFRHAIRDQTPLGLLMIDVDNFKTYNDMYGHQRGDECLRAIASAIRSAARHPADVGVRYGGDECAMLLPRTDEIGAACVAQAILANVTALQIEHLGNPNRQVGVSIGGAVISPGQGLNSPDKLVQAADVALYDAKIAGRNRIQIASG